MLKTHGGFRTGDEVEFKFTSNHIKTQWATRFIIVDFALMEVQLHHEDKKGEPFWVSIFHIRKPNLHTKVRR